MLSIAITTASVGDALLAERSSFLRSLVEARVQLEIDRQAAEQAAAERDQFKARFVSILRVFGVNFGVGF